MDSSSPGGQSRAGMVSALREVHLRDHWKIVWHGRWTVLGVFAVVIGITALMTFMTTPIYQATAIVEIQPKSRNVMPGQDVSGLGAAGMGWFAEEKYHNTQIDIIQSRDVAQRVVELLDLRSHPAFAQASDPVEAFRGRIGVNPRRDTGLIEISMVGADPMEITRWVNAVAEAYVSRNLEKAGENVAQAVSAIRTQMTGLEHDLSAVEEARIETLQDSEIFNSQNRTEVLKQGLEEYSKQLALVQIEQKRLDETLRQIDEMQRRGSDLLGISELVEDVTLRELHHTRVEVLQQLEEAKVKFRPMHPEYEALQSQLRGVEGNIDERVVSIVDGLQKAFALGRDQAEYLKLQIRATEQESLDVQKASAKYEIVNTQAETKKRIFDLITKTMNEVQLGAELMTNNVQVLDEAVPPRFPIKPRKRVNLAIGTMIGMFLGLGTVFFLEYLDNTIRTPEDVEKYLGLSVLGVVPKMQEQGMGARTVREAYQSLRTSIIFSSKNRQRKVLLITSTGPQEGKSSSVANLGRTLAAAGERVIVVDCDLRRPTQHLHHGLDRENGLTNFLAAPAQETDWTSYVKQANPPNLHVLTSGPIPPNPPELLGSERFQRLLAELRERYDWVLVDSPPAASLTDASVLASVTEMAVLVVQFNRTDRDLVRKTVQQLTAVKGPLAGAVLNNVDLERTHHRDYYYAGYYYSSEEEGEVGRKGRLSRRSKAG